MGALMFLLGVCLYMVNMYCDRINCGLGTILDSFAAVQTVPVNKSIDKSSTSSVFGATRVSPKATRRFVNVCMFLCFASLIVGLTLLIRVLIT